MAVRIKIRMVATKGSSPGRVLEAAALVNSGYEASRDECSLPANAAEALGFWPTLPDDTEEYTVRGFTGEAVVQAVPDALRVQVATSGAGGQPVTACAVISSYDDEILISDYLAGSLGLVLLDTRSGSWRLRSDPQDCSRDSEQRQLW